jgi:hypothetical protein
MYRNEMRTKKGQEKKGTKNLPIREYCNLPSSAANNKFEKALKV